MKLKFTRALSSIAVGCLVALFACQDTSIPDNAFDEKAKKIEGSYKITKVARNGEDITSRVDLNAFRLTFQTTPNSGTGTYTIAGNAPFVVSKDGTWKFDNPVYPLALAFTPTGETSVNVVTMATPVIFDKTQLTFQFSPGCSSNVYTYTLDYVNP